MTIKQFQELFYIAQTKEVDFDKSVKLVGVITGLTPDQVDDMPMKRFNRHCVTIKRNFEVLENKLFNGKPKKIVLVKGRLYRINYNIDKQPMNAGKYVETVTFGNDVVNNLHKIMASIVTPINWRGKPYHRDHIMIATDFEGMNFEAAYHAAVFFYTHYRVSMQLIQPFLVKELTAKGAKKTEVEATLTGLFQTLDGFITPKWSQNLKAYLLNRYGI